MRKSLLFVLLGLLSSVLFAQSTLTNDAVIRMVKAGLSDDVILATIGASQCQFDSSADGLIALKTGGVSDKVVSAIVLKNTGGSNTTSPAQTSLQAPSTLNQNNPPETSPVPTSAPPTESSDPGAATGWGRISPGSRIVSAPMGGFETYFAAAIREKKVPITLTLDRGSAQYFVVSTNTEWQGFVYGSGGSASWNAAGGSATHAAAASSTRGLEASIMLIDAKSKDVVWAYEVHKNSHGALVFGTFGARGQQSVAEACAKHLREYIEKGK